MAGKTITKTVEYDEQGRIVKETTVEVEWPEPYRDSGQWWRSPVVPWWQNPIISYSVSANTALEEVTGALTAVVATTGGGITLRPASVVTVPAGKPASEEETRELRQRLRERD